MPLGFANDREGLVADEEFDEPRLCDDVPTADVDGFQVLFHDVVEHHVFGVADGFGGLGDG